MAKFTLEELYYGDKYNIMGNGAAEMLRRGISSDARRELEGGSGHADRRVHEVRCQQGTVHGTDAERRLSGQVDRMRQQHEAALKEFGKQVGRASENYSFEFSRATDSVKESVKRIKWQMYLPSIILVLWELMRHLFLLE